MEKWRQKLHIEPPDGWLNDPNGLSYFNGKYHVFFQYSPNSAEGKTLRCWGHYSGDTLTSLEYKGIAIPPEIAEEKNGVYSGSAISDGERLHVFYTGNVKHTGDYNYITNGREGNVIHVESTDGESFSDKKVLLRNSDYPDFCSCHVRDPKVWRDESGYKMVLGARTANDRGCVLIFESNDLENWDYVTKICVQNFGYMWECPDYFEINGKGFLSISPQGLKHTDFKYQNLNVSGYFPVSGRLEEKGFGEFHEWDMGFDFYAPQSFEAPDKRRIMLGWMGMDCREYSNATVPLGWQHCLTLPREISEKDGRLYQMPIREIFDLFGEKKALKSVQKIGLPFLLTAKCTGDFRIEFDSKLCIKFLQDKQEFSLEFTDRDYGCGRKIRRAKMQKCSDITLVADMSSIEVYINGGETVFGTRFYPDNEIFLTLDGKISAECASLKE